MACKMRREKEDVCCVLFGKYRLHVWSGSIRLFGDAMAQNASASLFGLPQHRPKDGTFGTVTTTRSKCEVTPFLLAFIRAATCIIHTSHVLSPTLSGRVKRNFLML